MSQGILRKISSLFYQKCTSTDDEKNDGSGVRKMVQLSVFFYIFIFLTTVINALRENHLFSEAHSFVRNP